MGGEGMDRGHGGMQMCGRDGMELIEGRGWREGGWKWKGWDSRGLDFSEFTLYSRLNGWAS